MMTNICSLDSRISRKLLLKEDQDITDEFLEVFRSEALVVSFEGDKDSIFQNLRTRAMEDPSCGQTDVIEKKAILVPKSEIMVHAIVTNVVDYGSYYVSKETHHWIPRRKRSKRTKKVF